MPSIREKVRRARVLSLALSDCDHRPRTGGKNAADTLSEHAKVALFYARPLTSPKASPHTEEAA
jgi:hypothetical protein